jgi:hypothetical protein
MLGLDPSISGRKRLPSFLRPELFPKPRRFQAEPFVARDRAVPLGGPAFGRDERISAMNILISLLITILVIAVVLYLVRMLPLDGNIKNIVQIIVIIIGIISLLRYLAVF